MAAGEPTFTTAEYEDQLGQALPFRGLRMSAQALDQMLGAAIGFADRDTDPLPPMDAVQLRVADDVLTVSATDRRAVVRETRAVNQGGDGSEFLLQADDLRTVRSVLRSGLAAADKVDRPVLPVDLLLGDTGFLEVVLNERRVSCAPRETEDDRPFPNVDTMFDAAHAAIARGLEPLDVALNAELVARLKPLQKAGYGVFRQQRGKRLRKESHGPVLFTPLVPHAEHDAYDRLAEVLIMPIRPADDGERPASILRDGSGLRIVEAPE
jgi:hypothetical protein